MTIQDKDVRYDQIKAVNNATINVDTAEGIVEAFAAAIGNKDSVGDIIVPGAFAKSLQRRQPRVVWGHDWNSPIGKVIEIEEIPPTDRRIPAKMKAMNVGGLYVKVQFNLGSARGKEAFNDVLFYGTDQEWSIGYKTIRKSYDSERQANILQEVELYEVSPVLHGANNLTSTISIKDDAVTSTDVKDSTFTSSDSTANYSYYDGGDTSWDFQMNEKTFGAVVPPELTVQPQPAPAAPSPEMKLRNAFMKAFGPLSDLQLIDDNQAVFKREDSMWAVKYNVEGPRLIVTRPKKVKVRTVIEPIEEEAPAMPERPYDEMARKETDEEPSEAYKTEATYNITVSADIDTESFEQVEAKIKSYFEAEEKAGRVISQGNMSKLSKAADMIKEVITAGTRATVTDERPPMMKKDAESLVDAYKSADAESDIVVVKGETLTGKIVRLTSKEEAPSFEKVEALVGELVPLAEKHGWTLMAPSQKSLDDGTCSLGIHFSKDAGMADQVADLSKALKTADCSVSIDVEKQEFYGSGTKSFDEVFLAE